MKSTIAVIENNILATNSIRGRLMRELMEHEYKLYVLTTGSASELQRARDAGFNIIDVKSSSGNPLGILAYIKNLRKAFKTIKPDICLTFTIRPAIWGNLVTRMFGVPTITNITGTGPLFSSDGLPYRLARTLYKQMLTKTEKIFFQNEDDMHAFVSRGFVKPERAARIPGSGIDHERFKPIHREPPEKLVFLFIGRLVKDKGILEYVGAAEILKDQLPDVECRILGPLWSQNFKANTVTNEQVQSWVEKKIIKYQPETADVRPHIAAASCIVLPSYREGTSNVLLEAASMEKPAIACDVPGCREIIDDKITGFLCKAMDVHDLAAKMQLMATLSPEQRNAMGKAGRQKVMREFDKQLVIDAYLMAIENSLRQKR